jgi:multiple sugar transport system permease protein
MDRIRARLRGETSADALLVLLVLAYLFVFAVLPILYTVALSLQKVDMFTLGSLAHPFVGLQNYVHVLSMPAAGRVVKNTAVFVSLAVALQVTIGLALAVFFQQSFPGASTIRGLFLAGWVMPALVVGAIWRWLLAGDFGVINYVMAYTGITRGAIFWNSDPHVALYSLVIVDVWIGIPFSILWLSVGLAAIPDELYEAAALDGAGALHRFLFVTLPMMRGTLGAALSLTVLFTMQQYDLIAALTQGGPSNASNVAQYWSWQLGFEAYDISGSSAVAVLTTGVVILVAIIFVRSTHLEHVS